MFLIYALEVFICCYLSKLNKSFVNKYRKNTSSCIETGLSNPNECLSMIPRKSSF